MDDAVTGGSLWVFVWGWLGAARLTRLIVVDDLLDPLHERLEARWRAALALFGDASRPQAVRDRADRRYRRVKWVAKLLSCYWCTGLWLFLAETAGAAGAALENGSWQVLGGPWWFTLPNAALGAHWIYALANFWLDWGAHDKLRNRRTSYR